MIKTVSSKFDKSPSSSNFLLAHGYKYTLIYLKHLGLKLAAYIPGVLPVAYKGSSVSKLGPGAYYLVSLAAVFWISRNAPPKERGALRDIQKTAAREATYYHAQ